MIRWLVAHRLAVGVLALLAVWVLCGIRQAWRDPGDDG